MRTVSWTMIVLAPAGALIVAMLALDLAHAQGTGDERRLRQLAGQSEAYADEVRDLLAGGASPDVPDSIGRTALHAAAAIGAVDTLRILLDGGGIPMRGIGMATRPCMLRLTLPRPTWRSGSPSPPSDCCWAPAPMRTAPVGESEHRFTLPPAATIYPGALRRFFAPARTPTARMAKGILRFMLPSGPIWAGPAPYGSCSTAEPIRH